MNDFPRLGRRKTISVALSLIPLVTYLPKITNRGLKNLQIFLWKGDLLCSIFLAIVALKTSMPKAKPSFLHKKTFSQLFSKKSKERVLEAISRRTHKILFSRPSWTTWISRNHRGIQEEVKNSWTTPLLSFSYWMRKQHFGWSKKIVQMKF